MTNRVGQTWQEEHKIFVVVGAAVNTGLWDRHPVCYLDDNGVVEPQGQSCVDEGWIPWENQPYMQRIT